MSAVSPALWWCWAYSGVSALRWCSSDVLTGFLALVMLNYPSLINCNGKALAYTGHAVQGRSRHIVHSIFEAEQEGLLAFIYSILFILQQNCSADSWSTTSSDMEHRGAVMPELGH